MGINIKHVAVLLIHIDNNAAASINARIRRLRLFWPTDRKIMIAKRRCAPDFSNAFAIKKPPSISKIMCEPMPAAAVL
ncbi:hypothetical protein NBRC116583_38220 [Arenicella sp. 4NH20-0111]